MKSAELSEVSADLSLYISTSAGDGNWVAESSLLLAPYQKMARYLLGSTGTTVGAKFLFEHAQKFGRAYPPENIIVLGKMKYEPAYDFIRSHCQSVSEFALPPLVYALGLFGKQEDVKIIADRILENGVIPQAPKVWSMLTCPM